jgi:hypothetical protein
VVIRRSGKSIRFAGLQGISGYATATAADIVTKYTNRPRNVWAEQPIAVLGVPLDGNADAIERYFH